MSENPKVDSTPTKQSRLRRVFSRDPNEWMKLLVAAVFGVASTLIVTWWTAKEAHLYYRVAEIVPFQGEKSQVGIFNIFIANDGTKEAKNLEVSFPLNGMKIQDKKVTPAHIKKLYR